MPLRCLEAEVLEAWQGCLPGDVALVIMLWGKLAADQCLVMGVSTLAVCLDTGMPCSPHVTPHPSLGQFLSKAFAGISSHLSDKSRNWTPLPTAAEGTRGRCWSSQHSVSPSAEDSSTEPRSLLSVYGKNLPQNPTHSVVKIKSHPPRIGSFLQPSSLRNFSESGQCLKALSFSALGVFFFLLIKTEFEVKIMEGKQHGKMVG